MEGKTLIYCTDGYPGDVITEKVFVDSEFNALLQKFDKIIVVPVGNFSRKLGFEAELPRGVITDWSLAEDKTVHSHFRKLYYLLNPFVIWSLWSIRNEAHGVKQWLKGLYQGLTAVAISRRIKAIVKKYGLTPDNAVLYSMWFHDSAAALALLAEKEGWKMATRAHTADLYDEKILFRSRMVRNRLLKSIDKVFPISRNGKEYLDKKFPEHRDKIEWIALGSTKIFEGVRKLSTSGRISEVASDKPLELVTVASLLPVKRQGLIMDVLAQVMLLNPEKRLRWTIIGDGKCREELRFKASQIKIPGFEIRFEGRKSNLEIQRRYAENPPDWNIMMSYSEGIPVSMGEAMSYGIPIITTDVGDIRELVDETCAVLLDRDVTVEEASGRLSGVIFNTGLSQKMGEAAFKLWEEKFNSRRHSVKLAETLVSLQ